MELSAREYQLLRYFIEHRGATISRDELLNHVWGYHAMPNTRTVDVHVAWLRQKIEPNPKHPQYVITAHGLGTSSRGERRGGLPRTPTANSQPKAPQYRSRARGLQVGVGRAGSSEVG